ncbi:MAG TPA: saccharopine dehydrogenase NADP-binding domain-containing protein [Thermoanaerobaculia bacterium]|nr:saccharopine dehydrogenase NADP-binding domain-containing protein [Thermoanaerobaculia bacterium]
MTFLIYGANGYTGELIAREAVRRGQKPILSGRSAEKLAPLAIELGLEARAFSLNAPMLQGVEAVLHCAGPFVHTSAPMVRACIDAGAHYLDITGEIAVFEAVMAMNDAAVLAGVTLIPGVGFDVVPTDCLAAMLAARLPNATELELAFYSPGAELSRGTLKTMIEGIDEGGAIRRDGRIVRVPPAYATREIPFSCGTRMAMTIPWGDVSTAFHTTGIPNIRVYTAASPKAIARMRRVRALLPILGIKPVKRLLQAYANRRTGPGPEQRASGRTYVWGRVTDGTSEVTMTMTTPEGYAFTVISALAAVERLLASPKRPGSFTPAKYFGAEFVTSLPGVERT